MMARLRSLPIEGLYSQSIHEGCYSPFIYVTDVVKSASNPVKRYASRRS